MQKQEKKEILNILFANNTIISPDFISKLENIKLNKDELQNFKNILKDKKFLFMNNKTLESILQKINIQTPDKKKIQKLKEEKNLEIVSEYKEEKKKREVSDFISYFNNRYNEIKNMLIFRPEMKNAVCINRILNSQKSENVSIIGMINSKDITKNKNIIFTIEDPTGEIKVLINKENKKLYELSKNIVLDEVVGISGKMGDKIIFSDKIIFPGIKIKEELKKSSKEGYVLFLSDLHIGSKMFLKDKFEDLLDWLNQKKGSEDQKNLSKKIRYIFITGDIVDGIGIYPSQESELSLDDIYKQYDLFIEYISKIPQNIKIIISPGNHDAVTLSEPQPRLYKEFIKKIEDFPNIFLTSNPATIKIGIDEKSKGIDVMIYHGYGFDYYIRNLESVRKGGGYNNIETLLKLLLEKRHLSPSYGSTPHLPDNIRDNLLIKEVPDILITGHIHSSPKVVNYKNISIVSCGCWQTRTPFQEKMGHIPDPAKIAMIDLKTRKPKIISF